MSAEAGWPAGVARHVLAEADSTMAAAARLAPDLAGPSWVLALRQTSGRGRRGRPWADPPGNFAATLVYRPACPPAQAALRSFVAALALFDAFAAATGRTEPFALKWPNDVLLNGGKVAGILLESSGAGPEVETLAIGFGVNLLHAPPPAEEGAATPVSLMGETGMRLGPEAFLDLLAPAFAAWEARLVAYGFDPVRRAWLGRAARIGQPVTARTATETHHGIFESIDGGGALVLATAGGRGSIPAADVFFG